MRKTKLFYSVASLLLFLSMVVNTASAETGTIGFGDFISGNSLNGLGDAKPIMMEVVLLVVGLFALSCFVGIFAGGTASNTGVIVHSVMLRSKGITGIATVILVIILVIVAVLLVFHFYNKYLTGA